MSLNQPQSNDPEDLQELALYYPGHLWQNNDWVKNLLLYFDGIALLVPELKRHEPETADPILAGPLAAAGLLRLFSDDVTVDEAISARVAAALDEIIAQGSLDPLSHVDPFIPLSHSRFPLAPATGRVYAELRKRQLVRESEDGISVPVHPIVRLLILTLLTQFLRADSASHGLNLSPVTDRPELIQAVATAVRLKYNAPSVGDIVIFDLQEVGVDLSLVPLDEVLAFRQENGRLYRAYAKAVRQFARELGTMPIWQRPAVLRERNAEIRDLAADLRKLSKTAWRKPVAFALTIAGTASGLGTGGLVAGILGMLGAVAAYEHPSKPLLPYSYIFEIRERLK